MSIESYIRTIPDFPKPGIMFRDLTTLFGSAEGFSIALDQMVRLVGDAAVDHVAGIEARGFILGGALADRLGAGFLAVRKKGKLPSATIERSYELEYGEAAVEVHVDAAQPGDQVLLVDDLIATGGTALAAASLMSDLGAEIVAVLALVDLPDLGGSERLRAAGFSVSSLIAYEGD